MNRQKEFTNKGRYNSIRESVDLGPEFNPTEASRYTVVFLTLVFDETFDPSDSSTWKFMVENVSSLADHPDGRVSCQLNTERVATLIGASQLINNPNISQVICAVLKDLPEGMIPSVGDVVTFAEVISYKDYQANDRIFNTMFEVQQALPGAGLGDTPFFGQVANANYGTDRPLIFFDIFVNYLFSQVMSSAGKTPTSVDTNIIIGPFSFQVKFPFFTIPTPQS